MSKNVNPKIMGRRRRLFHHKTRRRPGKWKPARPNSRLEKIAINRMTGIPAIKQPCNVNFPRADNNHPSITTAEARRMARPRIKSNIEGIESSFRNPCQTFPKTTGSLRERIYDLAESCTLTPANTDAILSIECHSRWRKIWPRLDQVEYSTAFVK